MEAEGGDSEIVYGTHDDAAMVMSEKVGIEIRFAKAIRCFLCIFPGRGLVFAQLGSCVLGGSRRKLILV